MPKKRYLFGFVVVLLLMVGVTAIIGLLGRSRSNSAEPIGLWFTDSANRPALTTAMNKTACPEAPFILPSDGFIGLLYADPIGPYTLFNPHTGVDIFGDGAPGEVPVYAAYDGLLTRLADWQSSVIIRHDDPLQAGRVIWTYYTHMATLDGTTSFVTPQFPAGTVDAPVTQGTILGYQGEYAGIGRAPIGLHVHFSIVLSDAEGHFTNEARLNNTLDPSPYWGMNVNAAEMPARPITCQVAE